MIDRRTETMVTRLVEAQRDIKDIKSTQFVGSDNTRLRLMSTDDPYDYTITIPGTGTTRLFLSAFYTRTGMQPWQIVDYSKIFTQTWVGDMSTPYAGSQSTGLNIFDIRSSIGIQGFNSTSEWQISNVSGANRTVFIKFYIISTAGGMSLSWGGSLG